jgi:hypothetical protein
LFCALFDFFFLICFVCHAAAHNIIVFCAEALGNADGHDSTISADVVKESETANVSSIPPTG